MRVIAYKNLIYTYNMPHILYILSLLHHIKNISYSVIVAC